MREKLKTNPDPWQSMFEESPFGIARVDLEGKFLEVNRAYCKLTGYSSEELRTLTLSELWADDDRHAYTELMEQLRRGARRDFQIEARYCRKNGLIVWVDSAVSMISGADESSGFIMNIAKDITARRSADDELRMRNEVLQTTFDHVPVMLSLVTKNGEMKLVNREWERTLGWSLEEIRKENLDIFSLCYPDPDYRRKALKFVAEAGSEWAQFRVRTRDDRVIDTSWARVKLSDGTSVGIGTDITFRKRAEEALKRSEAILAAGQRLSHTGSWAWDMLSGDLFWSQETFRIFAIDPATPSHLLCQMFLQRIHPEDRRRIERGLKEAPRRRSGYSTEYRITLPNRSVRHIHDLVYPVANEAGQVVERYGVVMDITERKQAEEEQRRSFDQLRALTARVLDAREEERKRVAREIHDELGQALTCIKMGLSSLLRERRADWQEARRIEDISNMVDQTLKSVRRISTELRPGILDDLGLIAAVEWAVEEFGNRTGIECRLELPRDDSAIDAERATAIFRILQETLTNVARHANAACVEVRLIRQPGNLVLEVHDNGRGATEEQLSATGSLGIRGMRERALLLGGELDISGVPGQGTTARVRIPMAASKSRGA